MRSLLRFEFHKLFRSKLFYIFLVIQIIIRVILELTSKPFSDIRESSTGVVPRSYANWTSWLLFIMPAGSPMLTLRILLPILWCSDYSSGAIKTIISRGFSRISIFFVKLIVAQITTLLFVLCNLGSFWIMGTILYGSGNALNRQHYIALLLQVLLVAAITCVYAFSCALGRTLSFAFLLCAFLPSFFETALRLGDNLLKSEKFKFIYLWPKNALLLVDKPIPKSGSIVIVVASALTFIILTIIGGCVIVNKYEV